MLKKLSKRDRICQPSAATSLALSKEAADVVLTDDNFATIFSSVREGRSIYDNLMKSIQLLFINLVGDSLPSLALSVDHADKDIMKRKLTAPVKILWRQTLWPCR